jgi:hypothetical protein
MGEHIDSWLTDINGVMADISILSFYSGIISGYNMRTNMDANLSTWCIDWAKEVLYYHILYKVNWTRGL